MTTSSLRPYHLKRHKPSANELKPIKKLARWPLWVQLGIFSIIFYVMMIVWFFGTLEQDLRRVGTINAVQIPPNMDLSAKPDVSVTTKYPAKEQPAQNNNSEKSALFVHSQLEMRIGETNATNSPHRRIRKPSYPSQHKIQEDVVYKFNPDKVERYLQKNGPRDVRQMIGAFLEPETSFVVPGTINQGDVGNDKDPGVPPQFLVPLPLRTFTPEDLKYYEYPKFQTCHDLPAKLPVDRGLELDWKGNPIVWNVGNVETPPNYIWDEAKYCPVDADPFLPWIHDIFPSVDGRVLEFIAHNRRRCKTGRKHRPDVLRLEPQVALLQHVSVERLTSKRAKELAPELWDDNSAASVATPRYRLAPMNESATDGLFTRFICRFYGTVVNDGEKPKAVVIQETLSVFPFNYEFVSYRKNKPTMITPKGKDNQFFWTSVLRFQCPIPEAIQDVVRNGTSILSDGTPTLHVDLIPIRTPPRFGIDEIYLTEDMIGPREGWKKADWKHWNKGGNQNARGFDPFSRWGAKHVLPRVEASGRWTNLPICHAPALPQDAPDRGNIPSMIELEPKNKNKEQDVKKQHLLSACVWASASFKTRGAGQHPILDTSARLIEWIEFHLMVGFDHIYVFDNSGAHTNQTSFKPILDQYPKSQITRVEWPSIVCNNNIPAHDSTGERSSQYTAENSCRTRFGPFTEWIAAFDIDEYMIPAGNYTTLRGVVREASKKKKTNILSLRSSRARLLYERSYDEAKGAYRAMLPNQTFMEAYNCDSASIPKPEWAERARKQIYRADYVPYHYVHYSTVTQGLMTEYKDQPKTWKLTFNEGTERVTDEANEAVLLHTKTTTEEQTSRWSSRCHYQFSKKWRGCYVGFAWPHGKADPEHNHRPNDGMEYNCFVNDRIESYWIPKLKVALERRMNIMK